MVTKEMALFAKVELQKKLGKPDWLRGIGIGQGRSGVYTVRVNVDKLTPEVARHLPREMFGVMVDVREVGEIKAQVQDTFLLARSKYRLRVKDTWVDTWRLLGEAGEILVYARLGATGALIRSGSVGGDRNLTVPRGRIYAEDLREGETLEVERFEFNLIQGVVQDEDNGYWQTRPVLVGERLEPVKFSHGEVKVEKRDG